MRVEPLCKVREEAQRRKAIVGLWPVASWVSCVVAASSQEIGNVDDQVHSVAETRWNVVPCGERLPKPARLNTRRLDSSSRSFSVPGSLARAVAASSTIASDATPIITVHAR